jgi:hypothetical protein
MQENYIEVFNLIDRLNKGLNKEYKIKPVLAIHLLKMIKIK